MGVLVTYDPMVFGSVGVARSHERRPVVVAARRYLAWGLDRLRSGRGSRVDFLCNICGHRVSAAASRLQREVPSCVRCGSTIRVRALVDVFAREVFGQSMVGPEFPTRLEIRGIGISDQSGYSAHFARSTTYLNTWFHQEPFRDLMNLATFGGAEYDYVTCSEVLEHVNQPAGEALRTIFSILRPGGVAILTTPTAPGRTTEHYPALTRHEVFPTTDGWRLRGDLPDGAEFTSDAVIFHGGPGSTVEMRVWGSDSLREALEAVGFVEIRRHLADVPAFGVSWEDIPDSMEVPGGTARGLRSGVWTARRPHRESD